MAGLVSVDTLSKPLGQSLSSCHVCTHLVSSKNIQNEFHQPSTKIGDTLFTCNPLQDTHLRSEIALNFHC